MESNQKVLLEKAESVINQSDDQMKCSEQCPDAHEFKDLRKIEDFCEKPKINLFSKPIAIQQTSMSKSSALLKFDQATYKTMPCPQRDCSNRECLYFHNLLEQRRNPRMYSYRSNQCQHVFINGRYFSPSKCPLSNKCPFAHTKNEVYYHLDNYKKRKCIRNPCIYGKFCPDIHPSEVPKKSKPKVAPYIKEMKRQIKTLKEKIDNKEQILVPSYITLR